MRRHAVYGAAKLTSTKEEHDEQKKPYSTPQSKNATTCCLTVVALLLLVIYLTLYPRMWAFIGDIRLRLGDRPGALRAFDNALDVYPRLFHANDVLFSRGTLLTSQQEHWEHRHPDAEADLRAVLASQPDHANAAFNLGLLLGQTEDHARVSEAVPFLQL